MTLSYLQTHYFNGNKKIAKIFKRLEEFWFKVPKSRRVARIWKRGGGGAILKKWELCKRPWPEFSLFLNQFHTVCPKLETKFLRKLGNSNVFSAQNQVVSKKKKKKRSSPKLRLIFRPKSEIQTFEGGLFSYGGGLFLIFHKNSASKPPKTCDFAYFTSQWGARAPPWLRYCQKALFFK